VTCGWRPLHAFMQKVHGWTVDAVRQGAKDMRLSPAAAAMFDRPEAALVTVRHFLCLEPHSVFS